MKQPVELKDYRINSRAIAEKMWGYGGTNSCKTTRKGVTWYSCSSHGGTIVDEIYLTNEEKERIAKYARIETMRLYTQTINGHEYVLGSEMGRKTIKYIPAYGEPVVRERKFYIFEEDCDWSILYLFLGIYRQDDLERIDYCLDQAQKTFDRYYAEKVQQVSQGGN